jgi:hypothetical protein
MVDKMVWNIFLLILDTFALDDGTSPECGSNLCERCACTAVHLTGL